MPQSPSQYLARSRRVTKLKVAIARYLIWNTDEPDLGTVKITISASEKVAMVRLLIFQVTDIPPAFLRLYFNDQELKPEKTLNDYKFAVNDVLVVEATERGDGSFDSGALLRIE